MNHQDRALRKELLLLKGEALRVRLGYELAGWRKPARMVADGAELWNSLPRVKILASLFALLLPMPRMRRLLKFSAKGVLIIQLLRRLLRSADSAT